MTKEEMRIALAELDGWTKITSANGILMGEFPSSANIHIPNYPNDLNAMYRLESKFLSKKHVAMLFEEKLVDVCKDSHFAGTEMGSLWHSTAEQRAEAMLKTKGKYIKS